MEIKTLLLRKHTYSRKIIDLCRFVMHRTLKESLEHIEKNGIKSLFSDALFEMNQVNDPGDFVNCGIKKIWVYGEDRPHYTPHFHMLTKTGELEISIETLRILHIKGRKLKDISWTGFRKEQKALEKWLMSQNKDFDYSNYETICRLWNNNNPNNRVKVIQPTVQFVKYGLYGSYPENQ